MKLIPNSPKKALKAFLKQKPLRSEINAFKSNLIVLLDKISVIENNPKDESEEHLKNDIRDFLLDTFYKETNVINTKDKKDLVIHLDKTTDSEVGVIIEAKRPGNRAEMLTADNPNKKALHELILYYLNERKDGNFKLKQLIATNIYEWFIIDVNYFDKYIYHNSKIRELHETKGNDKKTTPFFYEEVAKIISTIDAEIPCVYFDIREYNTILRSNKKEDDRELSALLKILSPQHLLKIATPNDSNSLDERFYKELLHIIGLEETKEGSKNIIRRKKENRNAASLIELTIDSILTEDLLHRLPDQTVYGETKEEKVFNVSLELCIIWINRILFLKLLEGQLITYHQGNPGYRFLNKETINDFDELFKLFHKVLAVNLQERTETIKNKYSRIPYLNSSLFEISELEDQTIKINSLDNSGQLELINTTILKDIKKKADKLPPLDYLFKFLDAYNFASEGTEDVQEENKTIINASVLGKVFEKINGYKDGSIFTPAFITMYMCKQSIRLAVVEKFNEALSEKGKALFDQFTDVKNYTSGLNKSEDILNANEIINSLRICDPAVGSGHFLVSALNEIIAIKTELCILADKKGNTFRGYEVEIINDELIITDPGSNIFEYKLQNGKPLSKEIQRLQKTLFHEKQTIIENCLFGVDINPNSVKICQLRLWIELLKNAYYKEIAYDELETFPNIDINIKQGNSLLSKFSLDADLTKVLKKSNSSIDKYKASVNYYKNATSKDEKKRFTDIIRQIKNDFNSDFYESNPENIKLARLRGEFSNLLSTNIDLFGEKLSKDRLTAEQEKYSNLIDLQEKKVDEIKNNILYKNAFEWRFEFPEVLNDEGDYVGFDLVIGNPPYFSLSSIENNLQNHFSNSNYQTFAKGADIYCLFYEMGINILKNNSPICYITSNRFCFTNYGIDLRKYLSSKNILQMINFNDVNVFANANVGSLIMLVEKSTPKIDEIKLLNFKESTLLKPVDEIMNEKSNLLRKEYFKESQWNFDNNENQKIKAKIVSKGVPFIKWENISINRGITTGLNEVFIISEAKKNEIIKEDPISIEILKSVLKGANIKRFSILPARQYLIYTYTGIDISKYKGVYNYLKQHKKELEEVYEAKNNQKKWYELRKCSYYDKFFEKKLVWTRLSNINAFAISANSEFSVDSSSFAVSKDIEYLSAILNSKVILFYFKLGSVIWGKDGIKWFGKYFDNIPIPDISLIDQKPFIELVAKILDSKQQGKDSLALERKIDELVYKLYGITPDEQKIIEGR